MTGEATRTQIPKAFQLGDFTAKPRVLGLSALAIVVASMGVASAWILLRLITLCTNFAYHGEFTLAPLSIGSTPWGLWQILVPVGGALIVGLMARYGSEKIRGHGIPEAMEAILIGQSRIQPKVAFLKPVSSAIAIGTGGPFGAEGPIIMTGGALGSLLAQMVKLSAAERKTLLVAGASAGMTAVFGTPMAAVMLAVELLLFEWKPRSFIPVTVAAVTAAFERTFVIGSGALFPFVGHEVITGVSLVDWILIGLACGLGSGLLTAMVYAAEDAFGHLPIHWMWWPAIGGIVIGVGGLIEPHALGVGYDNIRRLLDGSVPTHGVLLLLIVKSVIWSVALGSGTSGGVLAPLLIMGGALGALFGIVLPGTGGTGFYALIGMAGMMGGTMRAPLTSTFFALELTRDYDSALPLLVTSIVAYAVTVLLLKRSILTEKVARRGTHVLREYRVDPYDLTRVSEVMTTTVQTLPADMTVTALAEFMSSTAAAHRAYPVVEANGDVIGVADRSDALRLSRQGDEQMVLRDIVAERERLVAYEDELAGALADRMVMHEGAGRIPVLRREDGKLVGMVTRKDMLNVRKRFSAEERDREILLPLLHKHQPVQTLPATPPFAEPRKAE